MEGDYSNFWKTYIEMHWVIGVFNVVNGLIMYGPVVCDKK